MNWRSVEEAGVGQLLRPSAYSEQVGLYCIVLQSFLAGFIEYL